MKTNTKSRRSFIKRSLTGILVLPFIPAAALEREKWKRLVPGFTMYIGGPNPVSITTPAFYTYSCPYHKDGRPRIIY